MQPIRPFIWPHSITGTSVLLPRGSGNIQKYNSVVTVTENARKELEWWLDYFTQWNGRSLISHSSSLTIETDASTKGWGTMCEGARTGGLCTAEEHIVQINCLELLAAYLAIKCFTNHKTNLTIILKMDSMSVLTYINKLGGMTSPHLNHLANQLYMAVVYGKEYSPQSSTSAGYLQHHSRRV